MRYTSYAKVQGVVFAKKRNACGLTVHTVANELGLEPEQVELFERGAYSFDRDDYHCALALVDLLNFEFVDLIGLVSEELEKRKIHIFASATELEVASRFSKNKFIETSELIEMVNNMDCLNSSFC